jgi:hypothetical protein
MLGEEEEEEEEEISDAEAVSLKRKMAVAEVNIALLSYTSMLTVLLRKISVFNSNY